MIFNENDYINKENIEILNFDVIIDNTLNDKIIIKRLEKGKEDISVELNVKYMKDLIDNLKDLNDNNEQG